jgi:hypothetical protein
MSKSVLNKPKAAKADNLVIGRVVFLTELESINSLEKKMSLST